VGAPGLLSPQLSVRLPTPARNQMTGCEAVGPCLAAPDLIALSFVRGLPHARLFPVLRGEANASDTPTNGPANGPWGEDPLENLLRRVGCRQASAEAARARLTAERAVRDAGARGIAAVPWGDPRYPPLLARIFDPPLALWVRGSVESLSAPTVAIVGSRAASVYGEDTATRLASQLAASGLVVASGLARGIDAAAHRGALDAGGRTVAVLGCGVDVVYPPEHGELLARVAQSGAVVSELPAGTPPLRMNFPERNRIISGLSRAVVVVEARQRSGALITADCALEQGREVMAVPGNVLSERHRGSHTLLKSGAALVETADDVLQVLKMGGAAGSTGREAAERDPLLALMDPGESYAIDALAGMSGGDVATLLPRLLGLELQGLVRRLPGGRFVRCRGNVLT
jgi:DNA processing protein